MSHTRIKTTYGTQGPYASTDTFTLYCDHNHTSDFTSFYHEDGSYVDMIFQEWESGNDMWDAVMRLMYYPKYFKDQEKGYGEFTEESMIEYWTPEDRERIKNKVW